MDYKILRSVDKVSVEALNSLEKKAASALAEGWIPCGGLSFVVTPTQTIAAQAVMKPD